jgi:hypothetical protein
MSDEKTDPRPDPQPDPTGEEPEPVELTMRVTGYELTYSRSAFTVVVGPDGVLTSGTLLLQVEGADHQGVPLVSVVIDLVGDAQHGSGPVGMLVRSLTAAAGLLWLPLGDLPHVLAVLNHDLGAQLAILHQAEPDRFDEHAVISFDLSARRPDLPERLEQVRATRRRG